MCIRDSIAAVWLIAGGAAILWHRTARFGAAALAILYGIFILFPLPRFYTAPHFLGYRAPTYIGVLGKMCIRDSSYSSFSGFALGAKLSTNGTSPILK